jgi:hypothetical protein
MCFTLSQKPVGKTYTLAPVGADSTEPEDASAHSDTRVSRLLHNLCAPAGELFRHRMARGADGVDRARST